MSAGPETQPDDLGAAWAAARAMLPPGGRITVIIEAWDADMRRLVHGGMHVSPVGATTAMRSVSAILASLLADAGEGAGGPQ